MKKISLSLISFIFSFSAFSQRTWLEADISAKIIDNLELSVAPQVRFKEKLELNEYFFDTGLEYKFNKYFAAGASYRLGNNLNKKGEARTFGRFAFDTKTGYKWEKSEIQFRLRYTNADDFDSDNSNEDYLRFRVKYNYPIKKLNLKPYAIYELYRSLEQKEFDKARYEAGLEYKISKKHRIGTFYRAHDYLTEKNCLQFTIFEP